MKIITLTDEQYAKLLDVIEWHQDEGPRGEGWQSDELISVVSAVRAANQSTAAGSATGAR